MGLQTFLTKGLLFGVIAFIFVSIFGIGGGFKAAFDFGQFIAKIPVWFWLVVAMLWLASQFRK